MPEISVADIKARIEPKEELDFSERKDQVKLALRERAAHVSGFERYYKLRDRWSLYLVIFISIMIAFQVLLTALIGFKVLNFLDYQYFLYVVIGENFAQIIAMGFIVVKFLFPDQRLNLDSPDSRSN
ncbi:hypothetical protein GF391_00400 [Candidatus Uhrbacteria bacterium]|nr:hypothetical protein [Candidatus Uhrbacteria bacterium]